MVTWRVLTESVRGASHYRNGLPNQDATASYQAVMGELPLIVAVADGHGSKRCTHSHLGAQFAVQAAIESVQTVFGSLDLTLPQIRTLAETLPKTISHCWRDKVDSYINDYLRIEAPIKNRYLPFGTTLLIACVLEECTLYWQIGDGDIAVINADNSLTTPIPHDARLLGNDTTSLCNKNASADFRYAFLPFVNACPKAIFLVSDGYKNSFKYAEGFYQALTDINDFIDTDGADWVKQALAGWLNESTQQGSGDDISLAMIYTQEIKC
jgi:serine/threonine protein phosphatase PrpC